jgi:hypothetical protein
MSITTYRRLEISDRWHFCTNCSGWPAADYVELEYPEYLLKGSLCLECITKRHFGECEAHTKTK